MADIPSSKLRKASIAGVRLSGLQSGNHSFGANNATYNTTFSASAINASASLTTMCNITVPAGKRMIVLRATLGGLTTTSQTTDIQVDIDGVNALAFNGASAVASPYVVGYDSGSSFSNLSVVIRDLIVESNFAIKLQKAAATSASVTVNYILVE